MLLLICLTVITIDKRGNMEKPFLALQNNYQTDYPQHIELKKGKTRNLKTILTNQ